MAWARTWRPKRVETYPGGPLVLGNSEKRVALQLKAAEVPFDYEKEKLKYHVAKDHTYTTDFKLKDSGVILEVKGLFDSKDRVKHLIIKEQYPDVDIRFIFDNSNKKLSKTSKTTYAAWCEKHGFLYADKEIPKEWLN
jgi:hypothetical protein